MNQERIRIAVAFFTVLIIWSTTPLAIQWSSGQVPMSSAMLRMAIGMLFTMSVLAISTTRLPIHAAARRVYLFSGLSIFLGMGLFYVAAQTIPSGWIAVMFGLSPLFTGVFSAMVEPETKLTGSRIAGITLGLAGLYLVFSAGLNVAEASLAGVVYTLVATLISSASSVVTRQLVKPLDLSGMQITSGSLLVAVPLFAAAAFFTQPTMLVSFTTKELYSTLYLGIIGSGVGFTLYYYLLKKMSASRISLITLITPISALSLGSWLNSEPLVAEVWVGAALVCTGLLLYEFKPKLGLRRL